MNEWSKSNCHFATITLSSDLEAIHFLFTIWIMCSIFKSFNSSMFLVWKGKYLLHQVANKGKHGGKGIRPSGAPWIGPYGLEGMGAGQGWPRGCLAQSRSYPFPPANSPGCGVWYGSGGDHLLQLAPAEEIKCGEISKAWEQLRG